MMLEEIKYPPYVQWEVTPLCNHNCIHCYNYWRSDAEKMESEKVLIDSQDYMAIAEKIVSLKPLTVTITGGEPLLVFDKLKSSIDFLLKSNIIVSINTNLVLLNEQIAKFFEGKRVSFFFSLPSCDGDVCSFITGNDNFVTELVRALEILKKYNLRATPNMVVSKINLPYVYDTAKFVKNNLGLGKIYITRVGKPINSDTSFFEYLLSLDELNFLANECVKIEHELNIKVDTANPYCPCCFDKMDAFNKFAFSKRCNGGVNTYSICTNGDIKACPRDIKIYGNILEDNFEEVWARMSEWRDGSLIPNECKNCSVVSFCRGGCRIDSYPKTHSRCSLDSSANISNLPLKYLKKEQLFYDFDDYALFRLNDNVNFVKEIRGYRISYNRSYDYITDFFYCFLKERESFSVSDIANYFSLDFKQSKMIIFRLLSRGLIVKYNLVVN